MGKVFHSAVNQRIDFMDERFYTLDKVTFYPSVTTVLNAYPKGAGFNEWLKKNGEQADDILREAGNKGSKVHDAVESLCKGEEVKWTHNYVNTLELQTVDSMAKFIEDCKNGLESKYHKEVQYYSLEEWIMILRFVDFCNEFKPKFIANEINIISVELKLGGTLDIVADIASGKDGKVERWLIDVKTSNYLHTTHELQLAAYAVMFNEKNPDMIIDRTGILWLKAQTRGRDSKGKVMQGAGWQLKEFDRHYLDAFRLFEHVRAIWDEENPNYKPKNMVYPDRIKLLKEAEK